MRDNDSMSVWRFIPPRERMKLLLMLVTVVLLVGAMFGLVAMFKPKPKHDAVEKSPTIGIDDRTASPDGGTQTDDENAPGFERMQKDIANSIWDRSILDHVEDNQSTLPLEALVVLFHDLHEKDQAAIEAATDKTILPNDLYENPGLCRGKLVYLDGHLEDIRRVPIDTNAAEVETAYLGVLVKIGKDDAPSVRYSFYLLDGPMGAKPGDKVVLRAYFLCLWKVPRTGDSMAVLVGKQFDPPRWLTDPASLAEAEEGGFGKEAKPVYYSMNVVKNMTTDAIAKSVTPATLKELRTKPEEYRGKFVSFTGALAKLTRVIDPNPTGLREYYSGYLLDKSNRPCMFYLTELPEDIADTDVVRLDGMFIKNYRYVSGSSIEREAPIIVGRVLVPLKFDTSGVSIPILIICLVVVVALGTGAIIEAKSAKRRLKEYNQRMLKHIPDNLGARARDATRKAKGND